LEWAEEIEQLVTHDFASAEKVTIFLDNLNTVYQRCVLYQIQVGVLPRNFARPVHGSWAEHRQKLKTIYPVYQFGNK
jgi:hypothetical protein